MSFLYSILVLLFFTEVGQANAEEAKPNYRVLPTTIEQLGFTLEQQAYPVQGELVYFDDEALRDSYPFMQGLSSERVAQVILSTSSVVTKSLLDSRGRRITAFEPISAEEDRAIYHPLAYIRSGIVPLYLHIEPTQEDLPVGLFDLKGIGLSPEANNPVIPISQVIFGLIDGSLTDAKLPPDYPEKIEQLLKNTTEGSGRRFKELEELKGKKQPTAEEIHRIRTLEYDQIVAQSRQNLFSSFKTFLNTPANRRTEYQKQSLIQLIRGMDYSDGVMSLDRAMKEIAVEKVIREIFAEYNEWKGSTYHTVRNLFVIALPFSIIGADGKLTRAAILGREGNWRMDHALEPLQLPTPLVDSGLGHVQHCGFGGLIDFELPSVKDKRVSPDLEWLPATLYHPIDSAMQQALTRWERGDKEAFQKVLSRLMQQLKDRPPNFESIPGLAQAPSYQYIDYRLIETYLKLVQLHQKQQLSLSQAVWFINQLKQSQRNLVFMAYVIMELAVNFPLSMAQIMVDLIEDATIKPNNFSLVISVADRLRNLGYHAEVLKLLLAIYKKDSIRTDHYVELFFHKREEDRKITFSLNISTSSEGDRAEDMQIDILGALPEIMTNPSYQSFQLLKKYDPQIALNQDMFDHLEMLLMSWNETLSGFQDKHSSLSDIEKMELVQHTRTFKLMVMAYLTNGGSRQQVEYIIAQLPPAEQQEVEKLQVRFKRPLEKAPAPGPQLRCEQAFAN